MHLHLTKKQRIELSLLRQLGHSMRSSATVLGVSPSTISRELRRNSVATRTTYHAGVAERLRLTRRATANTVKCKLTTVHQSLVSLIEDKLTQYWSPEQIAGWLKATRRAVRVCAQTIYDWLYTSRHDLLQYLRSQKQKYRRTRANTLRRRYRDELFAARRIDRRPAHILARSRYGHWEGDTMVSRKSAARIGTLVERKSGYLRAFVLPDGQSEGFARAAATALESVPVAYKKTMTLDNGTEMQGYELLERLTALQVFFAFPYHSWERGTNENTNGLLRQYFPKGSDLRVPQQELDLAVNLLNTRPRKRLNYRTPAELFEGRW
jgi:IS30 family transposase